MYPTEEIFFDKTIIYSDTENIESDSQCTYYDNQKNVILVNTYDKIDKQNNKIINNDKQNILIFSKI